MTSRKRIKGFVLCVLFFMSGALLFQVQPVSAGVLPPGAEIKSESAVNDYAAVYSGEQIVAFEQKMQAMREEYDCNVVAFLINSDERSASAPSAPELVSERYLDLDAHKSTVVLWLNICPQNRTLDVLGYGTAERKIDDSDADELAIKLQDYVKRQQSGSPGDFSLYVEMMDTFLSETDAEMRQPFFYLTWQFHLLLGAVAGLIVILVLLRNLGGKMTTNGMTYMDQSNSGLIGRRDIYTHTTYVRTKKSSSSSSGGGGRSRGGHSHSHGGGRF